MKGNFRIEIILVFLTLAIIAAVGLSFANVNRTKTPVTVAAVPMGMGPPTPAPELAQKAYVEPTRPDGPVINLQTQNTSYYGNGPLGYEYPNFPYRKYYYGGYTYPYTYPEVYFDDTYYRNRRQNPSASRLRRSRESSIPRERPTPPAPIQRAPQLPAPRRPISPPAPRRPVVLPVSPEPITQAQQVPPRAPSPYQRPPQV